VRWAAPALGQCDVLGRLTLVLRNRSGPRCPNARLMLSPARVRLATLVLLSPALRERGNSQPKPISLFPLSHWATPYLEHLIAAARSLTRAAEPAVRTGRRRTCPVPPDTTRLGAPSDGESARFSPPWDGRPLTQALAAGWTADVAATGASHAGARAAAGPGHGTAAGGSRFQALSARSPSSPTPYFARGSVRSRLRRQEDRVIAGRTPRRTSTPGGGSANFLGRSIAIGDPSVRARVSPSPYSYDHSRLSLGTRRIQIQGIVTELDDRRPTVGYANHRFHRTCLLGGRATPRPSALGRRDRRGPARTLEPWFANILNLGLLVEYDRNVKVNSLLGVDFESRSTREAVAQALLDDIQIDRQSPAIASPPSTASRSRGNGGARRGVHGFYTQVANSPT